MNASDATDVSWSARLAVHAAGLAALFGFCTTLYLFWPGFMTWDSTLQYGQALSGKVGNAHPPVMAYLWMLTNAVLQGPEGMLVVHAAAYWCGLGLLFGKAARRAGMRALLVLGIGWFPPMFWILPTVWKDVGALSFGLLAVGLLMVAARRRDRRWVFGGLACGFYAGAVRTPGLLAMLPLLWIASRLLVSDAGSRGERRLRVRSLAVFGGLLLAFAAGIAALSTVGVRREPYRAAVPLWDLARMSLARGELLIPDFAIHTANFDLDRLHRITSPHNCNFQAPDEGPQPARDLDYHQLSGTDANRVIGHWLRAVWSHPDAYLEHRWKVTRRVFVEPTLLWAHYIQPIPGFFPKVRFQPRPGYLSARRAMTSVARPTFYRPWLYVLLGLGVTAASLFIAGERAKFAGAIALSGLLSVAPLPVIAPSSDFRYSIWCVATSLVAVALLITALRDLRRRPDPVHARSAGAL